LTSAQEKLWAELRALDSGEVAVRASVSLENPAHGEPGEPLGLPQRAAYLVRFMDRLYRVDPWEETLEGAGLDSELALALLYYLVHASEVQTRGRWVSEKDLPGGSQFFRGVHALALHPLVERFGRDAAGFRRVSTRLGGQALDFGDASSSFTAFPRIPVGFVLWEEDPEFPARVTALVDSSISAHFPPDVVLALVHCAVKRIVEAGG